MFLTELRMVLISVITKKDT